MGVRIFLAVLLVGMVDFGELQNSSTSRKVAIWANQWIAENQLDLPKSDYKPSNPLLASVEPEGKVSQFRQIPKEAQPNNPIRKEKTKSERAPESSVVLTSGVVSLISENDQIENPTYFSENVSGESPSVSGTVFTSMFSGSWLPVNNWFFGAGVGAGINFGEVLPIDGTGYASLSGMAGLQSEFTDFYSAGHPNGISAYFSVGKQIGSHIEIASGVDYQQFSGEQLAVYSSQLQKEQKIFTSIEVNNTNGIRSSQTVETTVTYTNYFSDSVRLSYSLRTFEVPILVRYYFGHSKSKFFCSVGTSAILMSKYSASYTSEQFGRGDYSSSSFGVETMNLLAGIGYKLRISNQWNALVQTNYKYSVAVNSRNTISDQASMWNGLIGFQYYFK